MRSTRLRALLVLMVAALSACGTTARDDESATLKTPDAPRAVADTASAPGPTTAALLQEAAADTADTAPVLTAPRSDAAADAADPVAVGEVLDVADLWDLRVASVDTDAAAAVLAFDPANPAPPAGSRDVLIGIEGRSLSGDIVQPAFNWWITDGNAEYRPSVPGCGLLPDSIYDVRDLAPNTVFEAQICAVVPASGSALQLHIQPLGGREWVFSL